MITATQEYLSLNESADYLGFGRSTVKNLKSDLHWAKWPAVGSRLPNGALRFKKSDLDKWMESLKVVALSVVLLLSSGIKPAAAGDLSEHFSRKEFNQKAEGCQLPLDQVIVDPELIIKLEALRKAIGDKPIRINSGYRSAWYNAHKTTGATHSQHIKGKAADIVVAGMTSKQLEPYAKKVGFTFTQTYTHLSHLHVDVREIPTKQKGENHESQLANTSRKVPQGAYVKRGTRKPAVESRERISRISKSPGVEKGS